MGLHLDRFVENSSLGILYNKFTTVDAPYLTMLT